MKKRYWILTFTIIIGSIVFIWLMFQAIGYILCSQAKSTANAEQRKTITCSQNPLTRWLNI